MSTAGRDSRGEPIAGPEMRVLLAAKSFGFGSVSKLVALAQMLPAPHFKHFVGTDLTLKFARRNPDAFTVVEECDASSLDAVREPLKAADCTIVVREAALVVWAGRLGVPAFFFDSLLSFWQVSRPWADVIAEARALASSRADECEARFLALPRHEQVIVGHALATRSFAQRLPGVDARAAELAAAGVPVEVCGPIVNLGLLTSTRVRALHDLGPEIDILVNLGGFKNFLLDFHVNNAYLRMIERWACDHLRRHPRRRRIVVCCGAYATPRSLPAGAGVVELRFMPHSELMTAIRGSTVYMCSPGLTAIQESVALGRVPLLLPEQHYGHLFNARAFAQSCLRRFTIGLEAVFENYQIPDDDAAGSAAILSFTERVVGEQSTYRAMCDVIDAAIDDYARLSTHERRAVLDELRAHLAGPAIDGILGSLEATVETAQWARGSREIL